MIAKTIFEQIGGRRFAAMTGSKDFIDMGNGLRMSLARNKTSANRLDIIYDAGTDLYNMRFYRKTFSKTKKVGKETFVPIYDVSHKNKFYGSNQAELKKSSCKATVA